MKLICLASMVLTFTLTFPAMALLDDSKEKDPVKHVDAKQAAQLLKSDKSVVILDIRTPSEYKRGHLVNAKNIDYYSDNFATEIKALDPGKTYLIHCASGGRSKRSLDVFKKLKFQSLYHLDGGYRGWVREKLPVTK